MTMTQEMADKLNDLRARIAAGEEVSKEEVAKAIEELRKMRKGLAPEAKEKKSKKDVGLPADLNELF